MRGVTTERGPFSGLRRTVGQSPGPRGCSARGFSYRSMSNVCARGSSSSGRAARRLNRHLLAISKRHRDQRTPRIFHDQFALPPGRLREALLEAVRESRRTLLLTVDSGGGFELHDVATGRLLASDPTASGGQTVRGAAAQRRGDDLFVYLSTADPSQATVTIRVPVGIPALTAQLCGLYRADACPAAAN